MPNVIEFHPERNDDDWRNRVQDLLKGGYGQFRFQKVDGSIRELMCTLRPDLFPESDWDADSNQAKPGLLVVWAPKEKGYRTIKYEKVISFKFFGAEPDDNQSKKEHPTTNTSVTTATVE